MINNKESHFLDNGGHSYPIGSLYCVDKDRFIILFQDDIVESVSYNKWCVRQDGYTKLFKDCKQAVERFLEIVDSDFEGNEIKRIRKNYGGR